MSSTKTYHPLVLRDLEVAGLSAGEAPSQEAWQGFLQRISQRYEEGFEGALVLDERFDKMIRHAVDPFFLHDTRGQVIEVNHAACEMLGYSREEMLGMHVSVFEMDLKPGAIWERMTIDEVFTVEGRHRSKEGRVYPVETRVGAFMAGGQKVILALCRDVSERVERSRELRTLNAELEAARDAAMHASASKSDFLASMSHELRTPLSAVIGYSEYLLERMSDDDEERYAGDLERIRVAGEHLLALINDVLDLSKIEAGKLAANVDRFEVAGLLQEVKSTVAPLASSRGNRLVVRCAPELGEMHSDATRVRQILLNLLGNACKFTDAGEVGVEATLVRSDTIALRVWDTGVGMSPEALARVFEAFEQANAQVASQYGGTGLGLTLTERFCRLLGGEISARSTPGQGTEFLVELPLVLEA
ncbi:hypothetical protein DL240_10910 [Lujinxingia litoralis]|uniref:histidine kinase n=1 Tax=Lujinxingia litoralis TaxID=2211119 RepID=A0A328C4V3_9DELT|nr:PAS domain-containing sensor histidine kinase [Lujinxingia litoralis]RAL22351.1 hypothetical protein DL240_10910 [Lujinxingia litoralis]